MTTLQPAAVLQMESSIAPQRMTLQNDHSDSDLLLQLRIFRPSTKCTDLNHKTSLLKTFKPTALFFNQHYKEQSSALKVPLF